MHAAIDQLLSLRDGEPVAAEVIRHVEACAQCAAEFARLQRLRQRMQSLDELSPPPDAWEQIRSRVQTPVVPWRGRVAAASVAALAVTVISGLLMREPASPAHETPGIAARASQEEQAAPLSLPIERLVAQSRELDAILQHLPERPAVERVAMAATLDTIEQRVQWLDQQLSYAPDTGLNDAQTYQLWRERVDLMDSLVKVRYVEGGSMSF